MRTSFALNMPFSLYPVRSVAYLTRIHNHWYTLSQGTLYYRYCSGPPALLRVEASVSILLLFSVNVFLKRYEQKYYFF